MNHLLSVASFALDCGALTPGLWGYEEREKLLEFHEAASGARFHSNYFRPGGVSKDLPAGLEDEIGVWCETFPKFVDDVESLLTGNRIWKQRVVDIGIISATDALAWGFSGPNLRSSGVAWDLRRSNPTINMPRSSSIFPSASTAIVMTAIWSAWRKCARV